MYTDGSTEIIDVKFFDRLSVLYEPYDGVSLCGAFTTTANIHQDNTGMLTVTHDATVSAPDWKF